MIEAKELYGKLRMFERLNKYQKIFVTGPHRSGTTICARMISSDTGFDWYKEDVIGERSLNSLMEWVDNNKERCVLQCPTMCYCIHEVSREDNLIVLVVRSVADILKSQKRIGWNREKEGLETYNAVEGVLADVKYRVWNREQKQKVKNFIEVKYETLRTHWLWVPKEHRTDFKPRQTAVNIKYTFDSSSKDAILKKKLEKKGKI